MCQVDLVLALLDGDRFNIKIRAAGTIGGTCKAEIELVNV